MHSRPSAAVPRSEASLATDPADLGVIEAADLLRAGRLSAIELTEACLRRIDERNGGPPTLDGSPDQINAWSRVYPGLAHEQAARADERRARDGETTPRLCGVPIGLKDLCGVADLPLTASSRVLEGHVASADSIAWARLREEGMVLLGHTHTHEFGAGDTTDQVGNPRALHLIAGGSSGGSAAALAARMTPAAVGTDTGGSLRIPSACCGTCAIKPTRGRVPTDGIIPLAASLDHVGPMARSVADCAAILAAMATGGADASPLTPPAADLGSLPLTARHGPRPLEGITIGLTDRTARTTVAEEVGVAFETAARACERLGARIVERPAPWRFNWDDQNRIVMSEVWAYHRAHATRHDRYRPQVAEYVETAHAFTNVQDYLAAQERRAFGMAAWGKWFDRHDIDLVLEPTLPIPPFRRGQGYQRGRPAGAEDPLVALTALWNMTGMPVVALPVTASAGVSLVAPRGHEAPLVQAAIDLQVHVLALPAGEPTLR
jgi:aspartyl-tRNA(Asn)/glutamyl-tRNA(Gln) amidotransferase subunit A